MNAPASQLDWAIIGLYLLTVVGLVFGNFEWMAGFMFILLSLLFAPIYLRSRTATLPNFLKCRFNRSCRNVLAIVSLFSALVIHLGVAPFTARRPQAASRLSLDEPPGYCVYMPHAKEVVCLRLELGMQ
jgi:uncharacterized sodium:solute symporter family permease YidK